jgi:hypothetical protein
VHSRQMSFVELLKGAEISCRGAGHA